MLKKLFTILICLLLLCGCGKKPQVNVVPGKIQSFLRGQDVFDVVFSFEELEKLDFKKLTDENYISYKICKEFDFEINSPNYILYDIYNRDVLYGKGTDEIVYPASLTKVITLNAALAEFNDLEETSSITNDQWWQLVEQNASIANFKTNKQYPLRDLLYALILPSGADAGMAIANLFEDYGKDLVEEMNLRCTQLGMTSTNVVNDSGLHDDNHYTSLKDYLVLCVDTLKNEDAKEILSCFEYTMDGDKEIKSTLADLQSVEEVNILGGKTGFTQEAGQCVFVYYTYEDNPYILILAGADGNPGRGDKKHFDDVRIIMEKLYS